MQPSARAERGLGGRSRGRPPRPLRWALQGRGGGQEGRGGARALGAGRRTLPAPTVVCLLQRARAPSLAACRPALPGAGRCQEHSTGAGGRRLPGALRLLRVLLYVLPHCLLLHVLRVMKLLRLLLRACRPSTTFQRGAPGSRPKQSTSQQSVAPRVITRMRTGAPAHSATTTLPSACPVSM